MSKHSHYGPGCHDCRGSGRNCRDCCSTCHPGRPIGAECWVLDEDSNRYLTEPDGTKVYDGRGVWYRHTVIGKTRDSYILGNGYKVPIKGDKITRKVGNYGHTRHPVLWSQEDVDDWEWLRQWHGKIIEQVRYCKDARKIRVIQEVLNE